jgi:hypothetical protein
MAKEQKRIQDRIQIHLIAELRWAHTHGMAKLGCPELEIRAVPTFLLGAAGGLLNDVADYILGNPAGFVKLGERMSVGQFCTFRFEKLEPITPDQAVEYEVERWCLVEVEHAYNCACCGEPTEPGGGETAGQS